MVRTRVGFRASRTRGWRIRLGMTAVVRLELLEQIEVVDIGSPGFVYPLWSYVVRPESSSAAGGAFT